MFPSLAAAAILTAAASLPTPATAATWPDSFVARLAALAQIQQLNADLLSHDSATATLQHWCDTHGNVAGPRITAQRVRGQDKPADAAVRAALGARAD